MKKFIVIAFMTVGSLGLTGCNVDADSMVNSLACIATSDCGGSGF